MKCTAPLRHLGPVDITAFREALSRQPEELWTADMAFQKSLAPYRETETIYLHMNRGWPPTDIRRLAGWDPLHGSFEPLRDAVVALLEPGGLVVNAQIARLGPGKRIPSHRDKAPVHIHAHRVHVPVVTNDEILFLVDGVNVKLREGEAYELDNTRMHGVENQGQTARIHLIIDYYAGPVGGA
jgi:hypothetical protein